MPVIVLTLLSLYRLPAFYSMFTVPTLLFALMRYFPRTQLHGMMRYVLTLFSRVSFCWLTGDSSITGGTVS